MAESRWIVLCVLVGLAAPAEVWGEPEASERGTVLSGVQAFEETLQAYDRWAAQQELYPRQMTLEFRERLQNRLASLSAADAAQLQNEIFAKLDVLNSPQSRALEPWLAETLAVASDSYAKRLLAMLPDMVADNPGEVRAKLRAVANRRMNFNQVQQGFEQNRQVALQGLRAESSQQAQINAQLRASMTYSTPNLYSPTTRGPNVADRYSGYFTARYSYPAYPASYGFGIGFF